MGLGWKRVGAGTVVSLAALGGLLAFTGGQGAASCQRLVMIVPEVTAGEASGALYFTVVSGGCAAAGAVGYTMSGGTSTPDADFVLSTGQLQWTTGDTTPRRVVTQILNDTLPETSLEDFTVSLTATGRDVQVVRGIGRGRIHDDEGPAPTWAPSDQFCVPEYFPFPPPPGKPLEVCVNCPHDFRPDPYSPNAKTCVSINKPLLQPAMLHWETVDGTAQAGVDFVGVSNQVKLVPAGATTVDLQVQLLPRASGKPNLFFKVRILGVSHGVVVDDEAIVTLNAS